MPIKIIRLGQYSLAFQQIDLELETKNTTLFRYVTLFLKDEFPKDMQKYSASFLSNDLGKQRTCSPK